MTPSNDYPIPLFQRVLAWGVHLFTATGAIWGLLSILAIINYDWKAAFLWITIAVLVDGFDGHLARLFHTKEYASQVDGALLDNIIDYLNYVLVPVVFMIYAELVPEKFALWVSAAILLSSAYQFSQVDAKTDDHFFKGFPSYWNILILYLFILGWNPWVNTFILLLAVVLVFVPIKYIYPSRNHLNRRVNLLVTYAWGVVGLIALYLYPSVPAWLVWISLALVAYYLAASLLATLRKKPEPDVVH